MTSVTNSGSETEKALGSPTGEATHIPANKSTGEFLYFALRSKKFLVAMGILLVLMVIAVFGPIIDGTDPFGQAGMAMQPPSLDPGNWFGTTYLGEDVFSQFANGLRATFFVGLLGGGLAALIGMAVGFIAG